MISDIMRRFGSEARTHDSGHVVVLCQDPRVRDLATAWLMQTGLEVIVVASGPAAFDCLAKRSHQRSYLITDRVFPPWPGLAPIPVLKRDVPNLRVIIMQAEGTDTAAVAEAAGADGGITRPLQRAHLFALLDVDVDGWVAG